MEHDKELTDEVNPMLAIAVKFLTKKRKTQDQMLVEDDQEGDQV